MSTGDSSRRAQMARAIDESARGGRRRQQWQGLLVLPRHRQLQEVVVHAPGSPVHDLRARRQTLVAAVRQLPSAGADWRPDPDRALPPGAARLRGLPRGFPPRRLPGVRALRPAAAIFAGSLVVIGAGRALAAPPAVPRAAKQSTSAAGAAASKCASCHVESSWSPARFDHERTGFTLREAHARIACISCHTQDFKARDRRHLRRLPSGSPPRRAGAALRGVP